MAYLTLTNITKTFGTARAVERFDLEVERGEFISLLGGSGCGKTTTLRMIAGFETPTSGTIHIGGTEVEHLPPRKRNVGFVFQNYALFPNLTVAGNVAFGLVVARQKKDLRSARVTELLELIHMTELADRYPHQLSGGQQQRVALARALAPEPKLLLLDEPLSALDAKNRQRLRQEIRDIQQKLGITTLYVTHDQEEALAISDRVVVMDKGRIEQVGTPQEIYQRPASAFTSGFIGTLNRLAGVWELPAQGVVRVGSLHLRTLPQADATAGAPVALGIRPEALVWNGHSANSLPGVIVSSVFLGPTTRHTLQVDGQRLLFDRPNQAGRPTPAVGDEILLTLDPADLLVL
ncbi:MAG: ABC transporter ATP-binding protein [Spirochaetales bacterium]